MIGDGQGRVSKLYRFSTVLSEANSIVKSIWSYQSGMKVYWESVLIIGLHSILLVRLLKILYKNLKSAIS